jgi:uncharacterized protein YrrD
MSTRYVPPLVLGHDVVGLPVVDASSGNDVAEVRDVVFDPTRGGLVGFTLTKRSFWRGRMKQLLPIEGVLSVGTHAVMVEDGSALADPADAPAEVRRADPSADVLGNLVVTESGRLLGERVDVVIVGGSAPRVVGYRLSGGLVGDGLVPLHAHSGLSSSALVVPDDLEPRVRSDLTGLAAELADLERDRS